MKMSWNSNDWITSYVINCMRGDVINGELIECGYGHHLLGRVGRMKEGQVEQLSFGAGTIINPTHLKIAADDPVNGPH